MSLQINGAWSAMGGSWGCNSKAHVLRTVDAEINPLKRAFAELHYRSSADSVAEGLSDASALPSSRIGAGILGGGFLVDRQPDQRAAVSLHIAHGLTHKP